MKRSEINEAYLQAKSCFSAHGWALPPDPRWDITDFGLGRFSKVGLTLVNLAEEPEYCEKLMYARRGQITPVHAHARKKEDIICRWGRLALRLWPSHPQQCSTTRDFEIKVNGEMRSHLSGSDLTLEAGERITLTPRVYHAFWPRSEECIMGEVSTANDDAGDNYFIDPNIGRFPGIEEDEEPLVILVGEKR